MSNAKIAMYPVALSRDVQPFCVVRAMLDGMELVVWRDNDGTAHVWQDRCPHRSVRLSAGRNLGHGLQGVYHGWIYGKDGSVASVPTEAGKAYPDIVVTVLSVAEQDGFVWASLQNLLPPEDFNVEESDVLLRPLEVRAGGIQVSTAFAGMSQLQMVVTPWSDTHSVIFAIAHAHGGENPIQTAKRWNVRLQNIRRGLEGKG